MEEARAKEQEAREAAEQAARAEEQAQRDAEIKAFKEQQAAELQRKAAAEQKVADTMLSRLVLDMKEHIADGHYSHHLLNEYKRESISSGALSTVCLLYTSPSPRDS
eukprot:TRINITY_DN62814_c0_g1_i1.p2 TRINITY_DN62814_c0_g1~~TRINITY_DN62814_c0_g1_i1.p2  ORF type:complete len:107 (-),score=39.70 TRINITY_DN62814_c0_g1_i1:56-376(-)